MYGSWFCSRSIFVTAIQYRTTNVWDVRRCHLVTDKEHIVDVESDTQWRLQYNVLLVPFIFDCKSVTLANLNRILIIFGSLSSLIRE